MLAVVRVDVVGNASVTGPVWMLNELWTRMESYKFIQWRCARTQVDRHHVYSMTSAHQTTTMETGPEENLSHMLTPLLLETISSLGAHLLSTLPSPSEDKVAYIFASPVPTTVTKPTRGAESPCFLTDDEDAKLYPHRSLVRQRRSVAAHLSVQNRHHVQRDVPSDSSTPPHPTQIPPTMAHTIINQYADDLPPHIHMKAQHPTPPPRDPAEAAQASAAQSKGYMNSNSPDSPSPPRKRSPGNKGRGIFFSKSF